MCFEQKYFLIVFMAFTGLLKHAVSIHTFLMDLAAWVCPLQPFSLPIRLWRAWTFMAVKENQDDAPKNVWENMGNKSKLDSRANGKLSFWNASWEETKQTFSIPADFISTFHPSFLCLGLLPCTAVLWHGQDVSREFLRVCVSLAAWCPSEQTLWGLCIRGQWHCALWTSARGCQCLQSAQDVCGVCPGFWGCSSSLQLWQDPALTSAGLHLQGPSSANHPGRRAAPSSDTALCPYGLIRIIYAGMKGFRFWHRP